MSTIHITSPKESIHVQHTHKMFKVPQVHRYMSRRGKQRYLARGTVPRGPRAPTLLPRRLPCLRRRLVHLVGRPKPLLHWPRVPLLRRRVRPRGVALRLWRRPHVRLRGEGRVSWPIVLWRRTQWRATTWSQVRTHRRCLHKGQVM
jgi:hypothetical protein